AALLPPRTAPLTPEAPRLGSSAHTARGAGRGRTIRRADPHPVRPAGTPAGRDRRRTAGPRPRQGDRPDRRAPAGHHLPPAAHLRPRGLAAAARRRFLRARPPAGPH